jgi:type II secretory pathway pseudopilin PulG
MGFDNKKQGLTLVGMIMVTMILVILATAVFMWVDPVAKIGDTKDQRRQEAMLMLAEAISEYTYDHKGALPVLGSVTTSTKKVLCESQSGDDVSCGGDTARCLRIAHEDFYSNYLQQLPIDPDKSANTDTGYYLKKGSNNALLIGSCSSYGSEAIISTTSIKVTCDAYAGGYCWYSAPAADYSCDNTCVGIDKVCVDRAQYASDVDSDGVGFCALSRDIADSYYECGSGCELTTTNSPGKIFGASACKYREYPIDCSRKDSNYRNLCPCE